MGPDLTTRGGKLSCKHSQEGRLSFSVGADNGYAIPFANNKAHFPEKFLGVRRPAVGKFAGLHHHLSFERGFSEGKIQGSYGLEPLRNLLLFKGADAGLDQAHKTGLGSEFANKIFRLAALFLHIHAGFFVNILFHGYLTVILARITRYFPDLMPVDPHDVGSNRVYETPVMGNHKKLPFP